MAQPTPPERGVTLLLSAANFVVGMGAFTVIGMLTPLAEDFSVSAATAGWLMIAYSLGYAVLSPLLVSLTGAMGRRRVLAAGLLICALGNLAAALAPSFEILLTARIVAAAGAGLVTPVAAAVAAGLSPPERRARSLASAFFGFTISQVLGVPAGSFIAYTFGWQAAFALVFVFCLPVLVLIWRRVPAGLSYEPVSLAALGRILLSPRHVLVISFTSVFVSGTYVVFTYISPLMTERMGFGRDGITALLLLFGLGSVFGNMLGGHLTDRIGWTRTLGLLAILQAMILPWFSALPFPMAVVLGLAFLWSCFGWSFNPSQQTRLIALDPANAAVLLALNGAAVYIGTALGSLIGAGVLEVAGLDGLGIAGAVIVLSSLVILAAGERARARIAT